ncbi:MAG: FtsQ-type POTRA domain-containing protein [Acidobacteria bacterium]|nr:FtsQ-type POTRA domain-containing protein [Acidobacteriota bacterium]
MSAVAAPSDRRFRRAHLKPSRKRGRWDALLKPLAGYAALIALVGYATYRLSVVAAGAHVLRVNAIVVHGNERLSSGEVLAILSGLRGENLVSINLDSWRRRLMTSPWVSDAVLRRSLPSTIEVVIQERQPIGVGRIAGEMYLVDDRGVIIDQYGPQYADLDLPIIDGLGAAPHDAPTLTDEARADLAARVIAAAKTKSKLASRLSQVDVSDLHNASVILTGDPTIVQLGDDQFAQRLQGYLDLAPALHQRVADIDYVDLRFGDRIYVRPTKPVKKGR